MKTRLWIAIVVIVIVGISLTSMVLLNDTEADQEDAIVENPSSLQYPNQSVHNAIPL